jgi:hypothetical protein
MFWREGDEGLEGIEERKKEGEGLRKIILIEFQCNFLHQLIHNAHSSYIMIKVL